MPASATTTIEEVARILRSCLDEGKTVDIEGLGTFFGDGEGRYFFRRSERPKVFLAYVEEDLLQVERIYEAFRAIGLDPWMDRQKLMPGQNWPRAIEQAIETTDFFIACFSSESVRKRGAFQAEIRYALDCARRIPLDDTFLIPVRLDECRVPARMSRELQYIDLFPDWKRGMARIVAMIEKQWRRRTHLAP